MKRLLALWRRLSNWWKAGKLPDYQAYPPGAAVASQAGGNSADPTSSGAGQGTRGAGPPGW